MKTKYPQQKQLVPSLNLHKPTGQGYVRLNGRFIYLGRFDAAETHQKYHQLIAEWMVLGRQLQQPQEEITVLEIVASYMIHAKSYYVDPDGQPTKEQGHVLRVLSLMKELYGHIKAVEFGPKALKVVRQKMIDRGWVRRNINHNVGRIKRAFRWAVENELVPGSIYHSLQAVAGLRQGRTTAPEGKTVKPVPKEMVNAVEPFVSNQVWSMIQLQLLTAARPGEICVIRPCDIDRSGKIWIFQPKEHKTSFRGYERKIYIGPRGQGILAPFLLRPPESYCFSPAEGAADRRTVRSENRTTPLNCGNRQGTNCKDDPECQPGERYDVNAYRRAIARACDQAFIAPMPLAKKTNEQHKEWRRRLTPEQKVQLLQWQTSHRWHPHQLRHNAATELRKEFGLDTARIILGHRSLAVTTIYAEADHDKALEAMSRVG
ncbi:MAG: site-specific integrase [Planctomycetaceae bacterium]|nr:MAG: site-specific integrase [Planctomycetaceae bacterium]